MIWLYALDYENGEYEEAARVENGEVVSGDEAIVRMAFPGELPTDAQEYINAFNSMSVVASTDEDVAQPQPSPEQEEVAGDSGNVSLEDGGIDLDDYPEWDRALLEMQYGVHGESDTHLLSYSASGTPEFAKERLREAILSEGLFSKFDTIPSSERQQLREYFLETLQSDGWTVDSLADQIEQLGADTDDAERIARTETHELLADARERGYEERGDGDERFKWVGTYDDGRTTEACQWLLEQTNPKHGGDPVGLERLKELVQEAPEHDDDVNTEPREWTPHISCRKTFTRHVDG